MCVWCVLEWIFVCKRNKEIFLQPSLIISQQINRLYMKTDTTPVIYRGYYTVARRYEFYFRVAKQYLTNERSE